MNLGLQIKDNFLPKELFEKLANYSVGLDYSSKNITQGSGIYEEHVFLSNPIDKNDDLLKDLEKSIIEHFKIKIKNTHLAAFTCVNTKKATPHTDLSKFPNEKHLIIYLNGDSKLNAGTGFYDKIGKEAYDLNTAVGFYPNRAVIFDADTCWHSPLLYTAEGNLPRFSIIVWFEPENVV
tara:strand:+ start:194 stop:730 length:537 start_codon:yes stop_codon:yes gene_type:complete